MSVPVDSPPAFPVIPLGRVSPTNDGLVDLASRWVLSGQSAVRIAQGFEVTTTSWREARTVVGGTQRLGVWADGGDFSCFATSAPIASVGQEGDSILWTDWSESLGTSSLWQIAEADGGCFGALSLVTVRDSQLTSPVRIASQTYALKYGLGLQGQDVVTFVDGGLKTIGRTSSPATLCRAGTGAVLVSPSALSVLQADGGLSEVARLEAPPQSADCGGEMVALALATDSGVRVDVFSSTGTLLGSSSFSGAVSSVGLANGGWAVVDGVLSDWSYQPILSPDTSQVSDAWAVGSSLAIGVRSRVLTFGAGNWSHFSDFRPFLREVPDGRGGIVQAYLVGNRFVLSVDGTQVFAWARTSLNDPQLELKLWWFDSCSEELLLSVQHDGRISLVNRRDGEWRAIDVPVPTLLSAAVDRETWIAILTPRDSLVHPFQGGEWSARETSLPDDSKSVLPTFPGFVAETPSGIARVSDGTQVVAPSGSRLLGVSNGWVFWTSDNSGISTTRLEP